MTMSACKTVVGGGKRHIFLTGHPSTGKTTIIKAVVDACCSATAKAPDHAAAHRHGDGDALALRRNVRIAGLYTEESRGPDGRRDGFDLVCFLQPGDGDRSDNGNLVAVARTTLSRAQPKPTKGAPHVGKYLVDVENVDTFGVASLRQAAENVHCDRDAGGERTICFLDEVGKMEMLCPMFLPAVHGVMNAFSRQSNDACLLLGTIPTPRYGRVIQEVEDIRSREDVLVLHVTKSNRDELRTKLLSMVEAWIENGEDGNEEGCIRENDLEEFVYRRPIGSGSLKPPEKKDSRKETKSTDGTSASSGLEPCGPLVHETIAPRILILGHTASPKPRDPALAYCERSMWNILTLIYGEEASRHERSSDPNSATKSQKEGYESLVANVLRGGICIWDVLADVHRRGPRPSRGKRKSPGDAVANDLPSFLRGRKSIRKICFIGAKAHGEFQRQFGKDAANGYDAVVLPSSSPANSRMTAEEKARRWSDALQA